MIYKHLLLMTDTVFTIPNILFFETTLNYIYILLLLILFFWNSLSTVTLLCHTVHIACLLYNRNYYTVITNKKHMHNLQICTFGGNCEASISCTLSSTSDPLNPHITVNMLPAMLCYVARGDF